MDALDQAIQAFNQADLPGAIANCNQGLRKDPNDHNLRVMLCQFLCFEENWDRISILTKQLLAQMAEDRPTQFFCQVVQQLAAAEQQRAQVFAGKEEPTIVHSNSELVEGLLKIHQAVVAGQASEALEHSDRLEETMASLSGTCNQQSFDAFFDFHMPTRFVLECLYPQGGYAWIPWWEISKMTVSELSRPLDQCWLQVQIEAKEADMAPFYVYVPARYHGTAQSSDPQLQLGRQTDWLDSDGIDRGVGRRIFSLGNDQHCCAMQLKEVSFN